MRIVIVVEAIPPYCGGGEQVAWTHAVELANNHEVSIITFGQSAGHVNRDGLNIYYLPIRRYNLLSYSTADRAMLNRCVDNIAPDVLHCHMPHILSSCIRKNDRMYVSTIHDGIPENELRMVKGLRTVEWVKFKLIRRINIGRSDRITCVSKHNLEVMRSVYLSHAHKFSFIPNPISEKFFAPPASEDGRYVLNFGRQIPLKIAALLDAARIMPETRFVFVGTGEMVRDHGLPNVEFVGFSDAVEKYIDAATVCVFPSLSENFPLVGLEAMARGKPVIATKRGFSEYVQHLENGFLLDSTDPAALKAAIGRFMGDAELCRRIGQEGRRTAEAYRPAHIVEQYLQLYERAGKESMHHHRSKSV